MPLLGLIGCPLSHSQSPLLFGQFFTAENTIDFDYRLFPLESIEDLTPLLHSHPDIIGFNVTIPYKTAIIPLLSQLSPEAIATGAVNTVTVDRIDGNIILTGFNTDIQGFAALLDEATPEPKAALILGTGGASKAVAHSLDSRNIPWTLVSRNPVGVQLHYSELDEQTINSHDVIVNTTPLGMFPNILGCPDIPWQWIGSRHVLLDLVYNPAETEFMKRGKLQGANAYNGMIMLKAQAEKAWQIFKKHRKNA
jgi:shikimate dehydrogenase